MLKIKQILYSILIIIAEFIYIYGYKICKMFYNSEGLVGDEKKAIINSYWELRFSLYSVIIAILFYISSKYLSTFNKMLLKIGLSLSLMSAFDKMILKEYEFSQYDKLFVFFIIVSHYITFQYKKK